jgi:hypothetical protein
MLPTSRKEFKDRCLRAIGYPALQVEADDDQIEDRIDDALLLYWDYHYEGREKLYFKHQITAEDIANRYITLPDVITGVVRVLDMGNSSANTLFNVRYQLALNDLWDLSGTSLIPYYLARRHIEMFNEFFAQQPLIRFNQHTGILYLDTAWENIDEGQFIVVECYRLLDPDVYTKIWQDRWLNKYATALIKRQVAQHLKKLNLPLPAGVSFNGSEWYADAQTEIEKLEQELMDSSLPPMDFIG